MTGYFDSSYFSSFFDLGVIGELFKAVFDFRIELRALFETVTPLTAKVSAVDDLVAAQTLSLQSTAQFKVAESSVSVQKEVVALSAVLTPMSKGRGSIEGVSGEGVSYPYVAAVSSTDKVSGTAVVRPEISLVAVVK